MFFDKPWSEVSDEEIKEMATKLEEKLGGWVFHSKVDFNNPTPHVPIERSGPALIKNYGNDS